ncbi:CHASE2 domain-containing protein [candidate division KSB1 bacterium]
MSESKDKGSKKKIVQLLIGVLISLIVISLSWLSKSTDYFPFYEMIELKLLDTSFLVRGSISMDQNLGTIDIDGLSLETEGRYQDWTRDKYANIIRTLKDLNARMIGFDVFFTEASSDDILKKQDFESAEISSVDEVLDLFRDYDNEMKEAMEYAGNVLLGQSFEKAEFQDPQWVTDNTAIPNEQRKLALASLEPYSKDFPEWAESGMLLFRDIEPPQPKLTEASKGVGYAMTEADIDGAVRHYPIVLVYNEKVWPSLALLMFLEYIGADFKDIEIIPGKEIILPPGTLPDGTEIQRTVPINEHGLMMVNWTGDYADEQFFHVPHLAILKNKQAWLHAELAATLKNILLANPEVGEDPEAFMDKIVEGGIEPDDSVVEIMFTLFWGNLLEGAIKNGEIVEKEALPAEETYEFYLELSLNHKIANAFEEDPTLTMEQMKEKVDERNEDKLRRGYYVLKDIFNNRGGLKPEDYPLYFWDPEVDGKILRKSDIENKVFVYGLTAAGTHDLNPMPYNNRYPMVGLYPNILNTLITGDFLKRVPFYAEALVILFLGLLTGVLVPRFKPLTGAIIFLLLLFGYIFLVQYLFEGPGYWLDVLGPVSVILTGFTAITVYSFFSEEKEKKMIRGMFSRYVTKSVVDELIKNPDMLKLGGEKKVLTVFFSDVAGFTTLSEQLSPEDLVSLLNEYLTIMTEIILKYDGMVDKYEGDAIMAVFGTPIMFDDHALRACYVSLEMQEELIKLRTQWKQEGKPELYVRIGLNTGPMVAGNMGAASRLDYTVMGDSVNLGSRLEGANKQYGTYIMISEFTYEVAKNEIEVRFLDSIRVKGKLEPVKVYELIGRKDVGISKEMEEIREFYSKGIEQYLSKNWDKSIEYFNRALEIDENDEPSKVYIQRCKAFKENPPPEQWDGVFTMTTK